MNIIKYSTKLFLPTDNVSNIQKLMFLSALAGIFFLYASPYHLERGGNQFLDYANAIAYGKSYLNHSDGWRDIGYPLLLWLSGYPYHHSLIPIAIINTSLAIFIPVLVYLMFKSVLPREAYYIALAVIISLSPFYYIKWIHHDQPYVFFNILSFFCLSVYFDKKKPIYLYIMTLTIVITGLIRPAGNLLPFFFLLIAFIMERKKLIHYFLCVLIIVCSLLGYAYHRHVFFSQFGPEQSYNGRQLFQNLYLNSAKYHIILSSDLGPNIKTLNDTFYHHLFPSPAIVFHDKLGEDASYDQFLQLYVYPYDVKSFMKQIYKVPSRDYLELLCYNGDNKFLMRVCFEIMYKYPMYVLKYSARNLWHLLYSPGYGYTRYNLNGYQKTGIEESFPVGAETDRNFNGFSQRAIHEITFDQLSNKPLYIRKALHFIQRHYFNNYLFFVKVIFYLMAIAWLALGLKLISFLWPKPKLSHLANKLMSKEMAMWVIILSFYLFQSMLIVSILVDPLLRFHNHLVPFKIMLAGFGAVVLTKLYTEYAPISAINKMALLWNKLSKRSLIILLIFFILCIGWGVYIFTHSS